MGSLGEREREREREREIERERTNIVVREKSRYLKMCVVSACVTEREKES